MLTKTTVMRQKFIWIVLCLAAFALQSCEREVVPADDIELGKSYFPLSTGHTIEYAIDSIIYNDFTKTNDTSHMEFKDVIAEPFLDNEGRSSFLVDRYVRPDSTYNWMELMTYYITQTNFKIEVVENNLRFIKMVFPVKLKTAWDGNIYIPALIDKDLSWMAYWNYVYTAVNKPFNNGIQTFQNCVEIDQVDDKTNDPDVLPNSYASRTYSKEVYAKDIGLVYRELTHWVYQSEGSKYRNGFTVIYRAK